MGPLGNGFTIDPLKEMSILVAGGIGVVPLLFLYQFWLSLSDFQIQPLFLIGAKDNSLPLFLESWFQYCIENWGSKIIVATEDGSLGYKGKVTQLLQENLDENSQRDCKIYASGPESMLKVVGRMAQNRQIPCEVCLAERMCCGLGVCGSCTRQTTRGNKKVCSDGPVFNAWEVIWSGS